MHPERAALHLPQAQGSRWTVLRCPPATGAGMAATAATEQQDDLFDARFEFDAPRYYDFQAMSPGSPADKWFDTAPDGPGCKPESEAPSDAAAPRARPRTC